MRYLASDYSPSRFTEGFRFIESARIISKTRESLEAKVRITLGSWEHIKPYSVQKDFWGNVVFNLGDLVSIETVLLDRRACESNDQIIGDQRHKRSHRHLE